MKKRFLVTTSFLVLIFNFGVTSAKTVTLESPLQTPNPGLHERSKLKFEVFSEIFGDIRDRITDKNLLLDNNYQLNEADISNVLKAAASLLRVSHFEDKLFDSTKPHDHLLKVDPLGKLEILSKIRTNKNSPSFELIEAWKSNSNFLPQILDIALALKKLAEENVKFKSAQDGWKDTLKFELKTIDSSIKRIRYRDPDVARELSTLLMLRMIDQKSNEEIRQLSQWALEVGPDLIFDNEARFFISDSIATLSTYGMKVTLKSGKFLLLAYAFQVSAHLLGFHGAIPPEVWVTNDLAKDVLLGNFLAFGAGSIGIGAPAYLFTNLLENLANQFYRFEFFKSKKTNILREALEEKKCGKF